jgi:hypothetical protein
VKQLMLLNDLTSIVGFLRPVTASSAVVTASDLSGEFERAERELRELGSHLGEVEEGIRAFRDLQGKAASHRDIEAVSTLRAQTIGLVDALAPVNAGASRRTSIYTTGEQFVISDAPD